MCPLRLRRREWNFANLKPCDNVRAAAATSAGGILPYDSRGLAGVDVKEKAGRA